VPFIYNLSEQSKNPRDNKPKPKKRVLERELRLAKIQKALKENETKEIEYRQ